MPYLYKGIFSAESLHMAIMPRVYIGERTYVHDYPNAGIHELMLNFFDAVVLGRT